MDKNDSSASKMDRMDKYFICFYSLIAVLWNLDAFVVNLVFSEDFDFLGMAKFVGVMSVIGPLSGFASGVAEAERAKLKATSPGNKNTA